MWKKIRKTYMIEDPIEIVISDSDSASPVKKNPVIVIESGSESSPMKSPDKYTPTTSMKFLNVEGKSKLHVKNERKQDDSDFNDDDNDDNDDDEGELDSDEEHFIEAKRPLHYEDDSTLPVYRWGLTRGMDTLEITQNIINFNDYTTKAATTVPLSVSKNVAFIVNMDFIGPIENLRADDLGRWDCTGTKTLYFEKKQTGELRESPAWEGKDNTYKFNRRSYKCGSLSSLKKVIVKGFKNDNESLKYAFVQYIFTKGEQVVKVKAHGSAKLKDESYKRTKKSVIGEIETLSESVHPKRITHEIIDRRGGIENIRSSSEFPRNRKQIYNISSRKQASGQAGDPLEELLLKSKEEMRCDATAFVRTVQLTSEPVIFLSTRQQLLDIERFCTNPENFCVLGVDATFNTSDYYLTFSTYRNKMLVTKKGNHPVLVGPAILHKQKFSSSYFLLPSEMVRWHPPCAGVLVVGTDGEDNLLAPLLTIFNTACNLRCDMHMKDNISKKLGSLNIPRNVAQEYMSDIFGRGDEGGLVHCTAAADFDAAVQNLKKVWVERHAQGSKFFDYFMERKATDIKETMSSEIRSMCGLGFPPDVYTQNANECMNNVVKSQEVVKSAGKRKNVATVVENLRLLTERQEQEQFLSVLGKGEYRLINAFKFLEVGDKYYRMSPTQKKNVRDQFFSCSLSKSANDDNNESEQAIDPLSVDAKGSGIISVPFEILDDMFVKASILVLDVEMKLSKAPCGNDVEMWFVESRSNPKKPHSVEFKSSHGKCDSTCVQFARYGICAHVLAVAHKLKCLPKFLTWFKQTKRRGSYARLANINMPSESGKKKHKATHRRKGRANTNPSNTTPSFPLVSRVGADNFVGPLQTSSAYAPSSAVSLASATSRAPPQTSSAYSPSTAASLASATSRAPPQTYFDYSPTTAASLASATSRAPPQTSFAYSPSTAASLASATSRAPPQTSFASHNVSLTTGQLNGKPDPQPGLFEVTLLHLCDPRVSTCYGCGQPIRHCGVSLPPPADLLIVTKMRRTYYSGDQLRQAKLGNVYFHCNLTCITSKQCHFMPSLMYVTPYVRQVLTYMHKIHLTSIGFSA